MIAKNEQYNKKVKQWNTLLYTYTHNIVQYECHYKQCGSVLLFTSNKCGYWKKKKKVQRMQTKNEKNELCTEFVLHSAQWGLTAIVLMTE